jgi:two-component system chemotaxis sensor kinase CheA
VSTPQQAALSTFLDECQDLLSQVEDVTLALDGQADLEGVNHLFRIFHTVKGSSAMMGFTSVSTFTHHVETVLDRVRGGALQVSPELISVVLASKDHIATLIAASTEGTPVPADDEAALAERLSALVPSSHVAAPAAPAPEKRRWTLCVAPREGRELSPDAVNALRDDLAREHTVELTVSTEGSPSLASQHVGGELCYRLSLVSALTAEALRDFLIFVESDATISLSSEPYFGDVDGGIVLFDDVPEEVLAALPTPLPSSATPTPFVPSVAPVAPATVPPPPPRASPEPRAASPASPASPASTPGAAPSAPARSKSSARAETMVRVSSTKLDDLVSLVGELVITQSRISQLVAHSTDPALIGSIEALERLVVDLRDGVLGVQMMPIGSTFGRFKRLVHDLSTKLDKKIELVTEGAETELDKSVLDQLVDPLLHLVRNAVDHGIEREDVRLARGKPARGTVRLAAKHEGQFVVITITDDGNGLDAEAIRVKALERGLIAADQILPPGELYKLIFLPGFSTAKQVSDVSGRGVGMDVVKRQLDALRGVVTITSEPGRGATLALRLPLTLAIIDGLLVEADAARYIVPLASVTEAVELPVGDRARHNGRRTVDVRGALVPYVSLRDTFGAHGAPPASERVVLLEDGVGRIGIVVDRVLGQRQTVIQSLGHMYRGVDVVSGATILGDGEVALILDVDGVVRRARAHAA